MEMNRLLLPSGWSDNQIRIKLVGLGGTGSQVADQLASLEASLRLLGHPGFDVTLYDGDAVEQPNVGRQRFTQADIGHNKATLLAHRINLFYGLNWTARAHDFDPQLEKFGNLLITCTDKALFRANVGRYGGTTENRNLLWMDYGNNANEAQVVIGHLGRNQRNRIPNIFDLYPELAEMSEADNAAPSCSTEEAMRRQPWPVNREIAMKGMAMLWFLFRNGELPYHGIRMSLDTWDVSTMPVDPEVWAFYGYEMKA